MCQAQERRRVLFLGSYPPQRGSVASYTQALVQHLGAGGRVLPEVVAVTRRSEPFGPEVVAQIRQKSRFSHLAAAEAINTSDAALLVVEYDYDLFGGPYGEYILDLLERLEVPVLTTCHTIPHRPEPQQQEIIAEVCDYSHCVVTLSHTARDQLCDLYGVERAKIAVIPYGVPERVEVGQAGMKEAYGYGGRFILSTVGYLAPQAGVEYAVRAVAQLAPQYPQLLYIVAGQAHPAMGAAEGENYRAKLALLAHNLGVASKVRFIDHWFSKSEIQTLFALSDVYLTPHLSRHHAHCGTLAGAVAFGRAAVSTPYLYAQEVLGEGRGLLARFADADSIARCVSTLIENPGMRRGMEANARTYGQEMAMGRVCAAYEDRFDQLAYAGAQNLYS